MSGWAEIAGFAVAGATQEDLACVAAGLLIAEGRVEGWAAFLGCFLGTAGADAIWILVGRYFGRWILEHRWTARLVTPEQIDLAAQWATRRGSSAVFFVRFLPGIRTPVQIAVGMLHLAPLQIAFWLVLAAFLHVSLLIGLSALLGRAVVDFLANEAYWIRWAALGAILLAIVLAKLLQSRYPAVSLSRLVGRGRSPNAASADGPAAGPAGRR